MKKILKVVCTVFFLLFILVYFLWIWPFWGMPFNAQRHGNPPLTPAWALECWLWEDDVNTAERVDELLNGYEENDIPVRTLVIDSPWSTRYNDFIIDTTRYPHPQSWFRQLEDRNYRVVLWMTSMVNSYNKDTAIKNTEAWHQDIASKGFLAAADHQAKWWKGRGGFIDYTNPEAMHWWRAQQQNIFELGIDGWKLDGTATFFTDNLFGFPLPYLETHAGRLTTRQYMDYYYRDELKNGQEHNPEFVTLARPLDGHIIHPEGFAPIDAAPVTWVGDQEHIWTSQKGDENAFFEDKVFGGSEGLETAIQDILGSAELGYNIIGSDIGGFSGAKIPPHLYIRWAQFSTFCGLFLNGGHGERALWKRSKQELEIIRTFSWLHTELVPYMYNYVVSAHAGGAVLQRPARGKYHYFFGEDFLVAPIYRDTMDVTIHLPQGQWRYLFDDTQIFQGNQTVNMNIPLEEYPVFVRAGAIIPLNVQRNYTGFGDRNSKDYLTYLIYPKDKSQTTVYNTNGKGETKIEVQQSAKNIVIELKGEKRPHIVLVSSTKQPRTILLDNVQLFEGKQWIVDTEHHKIKITTKTYSTGKYEILF